MSHLGITHEVGWWLFQEPMAPAERERAGNKTTNEALNETRCNAFYESLFYNNSSALGGLRDWRSLIRIIIIIILYPAYHTPRSTTITYHFSTKINYNQLTCIESGHGAIGGRE